MWSSVPPTGEWKSSNRSAFLHRERLELKQRPASGLWGHDKVYRCLETTIMEEQLVPTASGYTELSDLNQETW